MHLRSLVIGEFGGLKRTAFHVIRALALSLLLLVLIGPQSSILNLAFFGIAAPCIFISVVTMAARSGNIAAGYKARFFKHENAEKKFRSAFLDSDNRFVGLGFLILDEDRPKVIKDAQDVFGESPQ